MLRAAYIPDRIHTIDCFSSRCSGNTDDPVGEQGHLPKEVHFQPFQLAASTTYRPISLKIPTSHNLQSFEDRRTWPLCPQPRPEIFSLMNTNPPTIQQSRKVSQGTPPQLQVASPASKVHRSGVSLGLVTSQTRLQSGG